MRRRNRIILAGLLLFALLGLRALTPDGLVLCVRDDGAVDIELAMDGRCMAICDHCVCGHDHPAETEYFATDCHGPCVDLLLDGASSLRAGRSAEIDTSPVFTVPSAPAWRAALPTACAADNHMPRLADSLTLPQYAGRTILRL